MIMIIILTTAIITTNIYRDKEGARHMQYHTILCNYLHFMDVQRKLGY